MNKLLPEHHSLVNQFIGPSNNLKKYYSEIVLHEFKIRYPYYHNSGQIKYNLSIFDIELQPLRLQNLKYSN